MFAVKIIQMNKPKLVLIYEKKIAFCYYNLLPSWLCNSHTTEKQWLQILAKPKLLQLCAKKLQSRSHCL